MRAATLEVRLEELGVLRFFSRPRASKDKPYLGLPEKVSKTPMGPRGDPAGLYEPIISMKQIDHSRAKLKGKSYSIIKQKVYPERQKDKKKLQQLLQVHHQHIHRNG